MPVCTCADRRLDPGMIAYGPHTRAVATSVPTISPRGTLKRDPGRRAVLFRDGAAFRDGAVRSEGMMTPCRGVAGFAAGRHGRVGLRRRERHLHSTAVLIQS